MRKKAKISKLMSSIPRHNPMGLRISRDGLVDLEDLLGLMQERHSRVDRKRPEEIIVDQDEKGRHTKEDCDGNSSHLDTRDASYTP
jgi:RNA:NAD 2'-phosphotransferase (TPT1/KptA family)